MSSLLIFLRPRPFVFPLASVRAGHFSLLAQRKVTKRNAPREPRPPRYALRVRKVRPGFARWASCPFANSRASLRATLSGDSGLPSPRLTGPRIKSNGKSKSCIALSFASARRTRALWLFLGPHGLAAAAVDQAPQGCARRIARIPLLHRMCSQRNPAADADPLGRMPNGRKALGRVSLVPFFARAKKGTRSAVRTSGSLCS